MLYKGILLNNLGNVCYLTGCETGKYGEFCNHTCDHCKNKDSCSIASGRCDHSGCAKANFLPYICTGK